MERFFEAKSVAVVGVSSSPTNLGRAIVFNLMEFQYQGLIYLVGPKGGVFAGHKIYRSVADLPEPVDLAAVLVPARAVPEVVRQCGEKGIKRIIVESAGFRELGDDRLELEQEIREALSRYGMRMIGPNCIGIINRYNGLAVPFMPMRAEAPSGRVAIFSQSGGVGATMINHCAAEGIGFSRFASIGNKLDVHENDLVAYYAKDPQTHVIFGYLEGVAKGRELMEVAARSTKPIVVHKSNRGGAGAVIARSHSASLSTDDAVTDAAFRQCGILRVVDQNEGLTAIKGFLLPQMRGRRLAIISRSGGHAVMAADAADEFGFELPPFPEDVVRLVEAHARAGVIQFHNPMDLGDVFDLELYEKLAQETLARADIDGLLFIHNYQGIFDAEGSRQLVTRLGHLMHTTGKPVAVCVFTMQKELEYNRKNAGYPLFTDPRDAVRALAWNRDFSGRPENVFATERPQGIDLERARRLLDTAPEGPLDPDLLASALTCYGISTVPWAIAKSAEEAMEAAARLGYPLVMKTASRHVVHKTDVGAVRLNVSSNVALRDAYASLVAFGPRVLVQKMAEPGMEWIVGGRQDDNFGPVLVVGLGGIYVEVLKETALGIGPLNSEQARALVHQCRGATLLQGVRGQKPLDEDALVDVLVRVSWFLYDFPQVRELDMNPVRVHGVGCAALDWRATVSAS
ncbi:acetate--CoA ligase family protein [Desulfosoma caldarium]|uniref:Acetyltransferase n=1 Tax=Desulfosoma caldarium TaxID=610254 RepID=A0A3N1UEP8_9BACT|nr:acetate--CoA ligase family protein [Desulfosoma caldarium]ROQ89845.1 acetyltransferase [Desulfosoma caldarium]